MDDLSNNLLSTKESTGEIAVSLIRLILEELRMIRCEMKKEVRQLACELKPLLFNESHCSSSDVVENCCKKDVSYSNILLADDFTFGQNKNGNSSIINNEQNDRILAENLDFLSNSSDLHKESVFASSDGVSDQSESSLKFESYEDPNPTLFCQSTCLPTTNVSPINTVNVSNIGRPTMINNPEYSEQSSKAHSNTSPIKDEIVINKFKKRKRQKGNKQSGLLDSLLENKIKECFHHGNSLTTENDLMEISIKSEDSTKNQQLLEKQTKSNQTVWRCRRKTQSCNFCGKLFRSLTDLTRHIRTHTGERPFKCSLCYKRFVRAAHLKKHYQTHKTQENKSRLQD